MFSLCRVCLILGRADSKQGQLQNMYLASYHPADPPSLLELFPFLCALSLCEIMFWSEAVS